MKKENGKVEAENEAKKTNKSSWVQKFRVQRFRVED